MNTCVLTISVPLDLGFVALQRRVDDYSAAQAHRLALAAKGHAKLVHNVGLEGDAIFTHPAICQMRKHAVSCDAQGRRLLLSPVRANP